MLTILETAGIDVPGNVEGRSILPLLTASPADAGWRDYVHGEHSACYRQDLGMQFLTDGKEKYIWYILSGEEQFFNLQDNPNELHNLARVPDHSKRVKLWRSRLVAELTSRKEDALADGQRLIPGRSLPAVRPSLLC